MRDVDRAMLGWGVAAGVTGIAIGAWLALRPAAATSAASATAPPTLITTTSWPSPAATPLTSAPAAAIPAPPAVADPLPTVTPTSPVPAQPSSPPPNAAPPSPQDKLTTYRQQSLAAMAIDGRWVAQLASKYDGVSDPAQTTAGGSHTFTLADILAEHEALRADARFSGLRLHLLNGTDYGKNPATPQPLWVTMVDPGGLADRDAVIAWCATKFSGRTDKDLLNVCYPRQLTQPG